MATTIASTDPRTLAAAFIAQAHSTALSDAAGNSAAGMAASARSPVGNGIPITNPSGTSSVLLISALLTVPNQTRLTAVICICLEGIAGLGYSGFLAIRRGAGYYQRSDLFPYVVFPLAAYALIVAGGLLLLRKPQISLDLVAAGMLALLAIGIRNSWAIATTIVSSQD